jgi:glycosyltransferase involved in cell wall biosynthesis
VVAQTPKLSVVIPTYKRPDALPRVLAALERQTFPVDDFEVVVVDDPIGDDTASVRAQIGERPYEVRHISRPKPGVSAARNAGWLATRASILLFLGDDIIAAPDLLARHHAAHLSRPEASFGLLGHVRWADELAPTTFMRWLDTGFQFDYVSIVDDHAGWGRFYTSNVSVKRAALEAVNGFDEDFPFGYEDLDIAKRMHEAIGFDLAYDAAARAEHLHVPTLAAWQSRMAQVADGERRFVAKHDGFRPYFYGRLSGVARRKERTRARHLARVVRPGVPWLGRRVWSGVDLYYRRLLAPSFLQAWHAAAASDNTAPK